MTYLKLQLDWKPNAQFAGILLAHSQGRYEQAGIELDIVPWQSHTNPMEALNSDENVIVSTEDNLLIRARAGGKPVKAIGTMMQYSSIGWMALKTAGIKGITELRGKRLGVHGDGETAVNIILAHFGLTRDELEVAEVGFNYGELLRSGEFDAVQCMVMIEPLELAHMGFELHVMPAYEWGYEVYSQVIVTTERLLARERELLIRFLQITFDGWREALQDPREVGRIIATQYLPEAKPELQAQMLLALRPCLEGEVGLKRLGWMETERWEKSIGYLVDNHIIDQALPVAEVMTNSLIEAVYHL